MENKVIQDRLALLRAKMQEEGIDFYMMPTADFHNSEYVNDYFKVREYFRGFGIEDRIREFDVSSATVELAAGADCGPTADISFRQRQNWKGQA